MDSVKEVFSSAPYLAWSIVLTLVAVTFIVALWDQVSWWWLNTWYKVPVLGKLASLSKDSNRPNEEGWHKPELSLCRDYKKFIRLRSEQDFNEKVTYLTKARDLGRYPTPKLIWVLVSLMVLIEAMGFSYVLAGYTIPGASENTQQVGALGIAFIISILLVGFTHFSGHEIYKTMRVKDARREWVEGGRSPRVAKEIALAHFQSMDDDRPGYEQLWNRVGSQGSYILTIITGILIVIVAIGATYVRGQVLEKQLQQQVTGQLEGGDLTISLNSPASLAVGGNSMPLPATDRAADISAKKQSLEDEKSIDTKGGWGTFIVLAFLFIFLQILGIIFGFKWGFAGKQSAEAYAAIAGYSSYDDVRERYRTIADAAQSMLENLQQRMMDRDATSGTSGIHARRKFHEFMEVESRQEAVRRERERRDAETARLAADQAPISYASVAPVVAYTSAQPSAPIPPAPPAPNAAAQIIPPPPAPPVQQISSFYYLNANRQPEGPLSLPEIHSRITSGHIPGNTMVVEVGGTEWKELVCA